MNHVQVIKLVRTDTTLDLSQKAEKGMPKPPDPGIYQSPQGVRTRPPELWVAARTAAPELSNSVFRSVVAAAATQETRRDRSTLALAPSPRSRDGLSGRARTGRALGVGRREPGERWDPACVAVSGGEAGVRPAEPACCPFFAESADVGGGSVSADLGPSQLLLRRSDGASS